MSDRKTAKEPIVLERTFTTSLERMWELWTTPAGIESWWGPDGFRVDVIALDLRPGGVLHYAMTATGPAQVEYVKRAGMPLRNEARATFTAIERPHRLAFESHIDFVPGMAPYTIANDTRFTASGSAITVVQTVEPMHDADWTQRLIQGRESQFDKLAQVLAPVRG
jgi:uncharacterized protein YndB with AHSA1/START domain